MLDVSNEIRDIAERYLQKVKPSGPDNVMALCPFHDDNTASFAMNITNGVYFCHSCHAKGNLFTFLRGVGVSRGDIEMRYRVVVDAARLSMPASPDPTRPGVFDIPPIPEHVLGHFDGYRVDELLDAGFSEQTLRQFDVGYDKWHGRITYPIRDIKGDLVGISGKTVYNGVRPKYKIYNKEYKTWGLPERGEWDKRKVLYNMHTIYPSVYMQPPHASFLVLVEGFKACMWVWQAGLRNVVALLGSYMSWEHRWLVERACGRVYMLLDNNAAGHNGTFQAGEMMLNAPSGYKPHPEMTRGSTTDVLVVNYPARLRDDEKAQPDNMTREEVWEQFFDAVPYSAWLRNKLGDDPTGRA